MKIYLVGGYVRDNLLGLKSISDKDWLVVGSSYSKMLKLGYKPVGNFFPVFLHPITKEEYALARKEYKNGLGYKGFNCVFDKSISLEEDLYRRDLTINAIAMDKKGKYYDPYNGLEDIKNRIIKHVSNFFSDDPLRLIRVARFKAYLFNLNFYIHKDTYFLMKNIVLKGELLYISPERIWIELRKVLILNKNIYIFFKVLKSCNALYIIYPELNNIFNSNILKYFFKLIFSKLEFYNYGYNLNFIFLFFFFHYTFLYKSFYDKKKFIINSIKNFYKKFNLPKKLFLLCKKSYYLIYEIYMYKKNIDISIFILNIFYKIDIWRDNNFIIIVLKIIKILKLINIYDFFILNILEKYILKVFTKINKINFKKLLKIKNFKNFVDIKNYIYNLRLRKIKNIFCNI